MIRLAVAVSLAFALAALPSARAAEKVKAAPSTESKSAGKADRTCGGCGARILGDETTCPACGSEISAKPAAPEVAVGLCAVGEKALLSCEMKKGGKTLSICASKDFNLKDAVPVGKVDYRFGKPGKADRSWPEAGADSKKAFLYKAEAKSSGARVVAISYEGTDGSLHSAYVRYMGQRVVAAGELVTAKGHKKAQDLECKVPGESALGEVVDSSFSREAFADSELDAVNALLKR